MFASRFFAVFGLVLAFFLASVFFVSSALAQQTGPYRILSVSPGEITLEIAPHYNSHTVAGTDGHSYTEIGFFGGISRDSAGAPDVLRLPLNFLTPSQKPAEIQVLSQSLEVLPNVDLPPVPTIVTKNGNAVPEYTPNARYFLQNSGDLYAAEAVGRFRNAFSERIWISPIQYDPETRSLTRVKSLVLRISFADASLARSNSNVLSHEEAEFFHALFINGSVSQFYNCAAPEITDNLQKSAKNIALSTAGSGQWLEITTTNEGVYRISAQDLASNGISGPIDPNSIELFGTGGLMLVENVTDSSGEWLQTPIEVRTDASGFKELYFYASSATNWRYSSYPGGTDGLFHELNPYTSAGHFLLKIGGDNIGNPLRIPVQPDSPSRPAAPANRVLAAINRENDRTLEIPNIGREMLDQAIPRSDAPSPLNFSVDAPGYTGDSSVLRVGFDSQVDSDQNNPASGSVAVTVNSEKVATIQTRVNGGPDRNWDNTTVLDPAIQAPLNVSLSFTSSSITGSATLDFVELIYRRSTDIGSVQIPFFILDTGAAFHYNFTSATGGELWDITNPFAAHVVASASGDAISVDLQGMVHQMRHFIAFSGASLQTPSISSVSVPNLRSGVCQTGATEIIIAPQEFLPQANELAQLREQGGEATEAMSAVVVSIDDVFREFGYGSHDVTALRDFMAYLFRHASTKPVYLTLLGGGHCDYQNRQTSASNWIPVWENEPYPAPGFRSSFGAEPNPDDGYFAQLTPGGSYDLAVGRISARNTDDADVYVQKVREYEHASDTGAWRSVATFLADDHYDPEPEFEQEGFVDPLDHFFDTENETTHVQDRVSIKKIYESSYPTVISSTGQRLKPLVNQAIENAFASGTMLFSFIGHGNPEVWTHESVLNVPGSITQMTNFDRLAYVTTATCDFSRYDDFSFFSGGELFLMNPTGGAIGLLGTSRSVTSGEPLVQYFYDALFHHDPDLGTSTVGVALLAGKAHASPNGPFFYLLGDPAQRLLLPKLYVAFDSLNGAPMSDSTTIPALSQVRVSGSIRTGSEPDASTDATFNGTVTVTLYDTPTHKIATSYFPQASPPETITDSYSVDGPVLYRGTATVTNGQFSIAFIVPRDLKLDSGSAKFSGYAYSGSDFRTALGDKTGIALTGDTAILANDTGGIRLQLWLGNRAFQSGDAVSMSSTAIVDIDATHGLNTSTASIGHSFIAWVDNAMDSSVDMASTYTSKSNDFTQGTSEHAIALPPGHHTLHVRAFDTYDNAAFASVDFVAKKDAPYQLYDVTAVPNPITDHTTFSFVQPGNAGSVVNVTLNIYTTDGRLIRSLTASSSESAIEIPWDGRDVTGTAVANGAYVFTIDAVDVGDGTTSVATGKCIVKR